MFSRCNRDALAAVQSSFRELVHKDAGGLAARLREEHVETLLLRMVRRFRGYPTTAEVFLHLKNHFGNEPEEFYRLSR